MELTCAACGSKFKKDKFEYRRRIKLGQINFFCNLKCKGTTAIQNIPREAVLRGALAGRTLDEFSPFRLFYKKTQNAKYGPSNIDLTFLRELWTTQKGICPYTKKNMKLYPSCTPPSHHRELHAASLDRIDSSKGYIKGNVEFVCLGINFMKNGFSKIDVLEFLK